MSAIADAFLGELARRRGQMSVDVTSAQPLTEDQILSDRADSALVRAAVRTDAELHFLPADLVQRGDPTRHVRERLAHLVGRQPVRLS